MLIATSCVSNEGEGVYNERSVTFAKVNLAPHRSHPNQSSRHTTVEWTQTSRGSRAPAQTSFHWAQA